MFLSVVAALIVSVDAFFIGISLGLKKSCKFLYVVAISFILLALCVAGYFIAGQVYEAIPIDPDYIVGISFISLGTFGIVYYFATAHGSKGHAKRENNKPAHKTIAAIGAIMSLEAMVITMGLSLIFMPQSTIVIPLAVALAHFCYAAISFRLVRIKRVQRLPVMWAHILSGAGLIVYGVMALVL